MGILAPCLQLNILLVAVEGDLDTILYNKWKIGGARSDADGYEYIKAVTRLQFKVILLRARRAVDIDMKKRLAAAHQFYGFQPEFLIVVVDDLDGSRDRTGGCEDRIEEKGIGRKINASVPAGNKRIFPAGEYHAGKHHKDGEGSYDER